MKVKIFDSSFLFTGAKATTLHLSPERFNDEPEHFTWDKQDGSNMEFNENIWISDACLMSHTMDIKTTGKKIAWLIESMSLRPNHYEFVRENHDLFDYILTSNYMFRSALREAHGYNNALWIPAASSFVKKDRWGIIPKTKLASMIVSDKLMTPMHIFRADVALFAEQNGVDVFGTGRGKYISHYDAISDYMFHIVVEGCNEMGVFSEKVIDCFALGTVPIYKGCENSLNMFFDGRGIINFNKVKDLEDILTTLNTERYINMVNAIEINNKDAKNLYTAEDWIYRKYPMLFE